MTRVIAALIALLLIGNAASALAQKNKRPSGPQIPDVNRILKDVQGKVNRIKNDVKRESPRVPQPSRQPSPAPKHNTPVPLKPVPTPSQSSASRRPASRVGAAPVAEADSPSTQSEMLVIDSPTATLEGGRFLLFSPKGNLLLTAGIHTARLWEVGTWKGRETAVPLRVLGYTGNLQFSRRAAAISTNDSLLASVSATDLGQQIVTTWDLNKTPVSPAHRVEVNGFNSTVYWNGVIWSKDGETLITRSINGGMAFWGADGLKGETPNSVAGHVRGGSVASNQKYLAENDQWHWTEDAALSPDGKLLATSFQKGVRIWEVPSGKELHWLRTPDDSQKWKNYPFFGFSPDGKTLATTLKGSGSKQTEWREVQLVKLWDTATWTERVALTAPPHPKYGFLSNFKFVCFSPGSEYVVTTAGSTYDNFVSVWDTSTGKRLRHIKTKFPRDVLFFSDSRTLVTGGHARVERDKPNHVNFWDVTTGRLRARIITSGVYTIALSPNSRWLVTGDGQESAQVWDLTKHCKAPYVDEYTE